MPRVLPRLILACAFALAAALLPAATAGAAGWLPMTTALNGTGAAIGTPRVAVDNAGNAYAVWTEGNFVEASKRPVGGAFETPQTIDNGSGGKADVPDIGVDGAGNALIVWRTHNAAGGPQITKLARRAAGAASFDVAGATQISSTVNGTGPPRIDVNRNGEAIVAFVNAITSATAITAALGSTTGAFTVREAASSGTPGDPTVDINEAGDAAVVFTAASTTPEIRALYRARTQAFPPPSSGFELADGSIVANKKEPHVSVDSTGRALVIWSEAANGTIAGASRSAGTGGSWSAIADLDTPAAGGTSPRITSETGDNALAAWAGDNILRFATRPAAAANFGAPQPLTDSSEAPGDIDVDSLGGTTVLAWAGGATSTVARAVVRAAGGAFSPIATLSPSGRLGTQPDVAVAPTGNAAAVWVDTNTSETDPKLATSVYDATAPALGSPTVPGTATTAQETAMSATATDDWSTPVIAWSFGDGAIGFGDAVNHTYTTPGTYTVTTTAIDSAGNQSAPKTSSIVVSDLTPPPPEPPIRGVDFNASSVSGKVLVSVPKNAAAPKVLARAPVARSAAAISPPAGYTPFRLLGKDDNIPVGSILDATRGISSITMAQNAAGTITQKGQFSKGVFRTKQTKSSPLTTAVMMGGGNFKRDCRAPKARAGSAGLRAARRRPSRRLFASVKGRFRTRGRNSTATVRGTKYLVKDSCSGTTTRVIKGTVVVRDLVKHKNHVVRTGHRYIARPKRAKRH